MTKTYVVDGQDRYVIDYRPQSDGTIKMFALDHPDNPHDDPVSVHHLYSSGEICVSAGHEPRTFDRAKAIACTWMQGFSRYVRTGTFPSGTKRFKSDPPRVAYRWQLVPPAAWRRTTTGTSSRRSLDMNRLQRVVFGIEEVPDGVLHN